MSGIEVVGLVCAIVSAFAGALGLFRRRTRQNDWKTVPVRESLAQGRLRIQAEYDRHFARLGQRFALGDCKGDLFLCGNFISGGLNWPEAN